MRHHVIKDEHLGNPVIASSDVENPFDNLEAPSGDGLPQTQQLSDAIMHEYDRLMAVSGVVSSLSRNTTNLNEVKSIVNRVGERVGDDLLTPFYVHLSTGINSYWGCKHIWNQAGMLANLGGFIPNIHEYLEGRRNLFGEADIAHGKCFLDILQIPENTSCLEIGAGAHSERILDLQSSLQGNSQLLCLDPTLAAPKDMFPKTGVPYTALPSHPDFLGSVLPILPGEKIITCRDTVSSMGFPEIDAVSELVRNGSAKQLFITQSLGVADTSTMYPYPEGFSVTSPDFIQYVTMNYPREVLNAGPVRQGVFLAQVIVTLKRLMLECVRERIKTNGGLQENGAYLVEQEQLLSGESVGNAFKYMLESKLGDFEGSFLSGNLNSIYLSPFGLHCENDKKIPAGVLKLGRTHLHMVFGREKEKHQLPSQSENLQKAKKVTSLKNSDSLMPQEWKWVDPIAAYNTAGFSTGIPESDFIQACLKDRAKYLQTARAGAQVAWGLIFKHWGAEWGYSGVKAYYKQLAAKTSSTYA